MLPNYADIIKLRKKYKMSTRELASALSPHVSASWINKVEKKNLNPTYDKIKKIADYFEKLEQKKGMPIGKISHKIISFNIGDDVKKINAKMSEKGISQVLIQQEKVPIGILTDKIIFRILALEIKNPKVTRDYLDPIPPKIQYEDSIHKVISIFELYNYIFVEKNEKLFGIVTRQDMIDEGFKSNNFS